MSRRVACALLAFLSAGSPARAQQVDSTHLADRFAEATESRLDSLYGPLLYLMQAEERGIYSTLTLDGKRDYLRRFWARRDPTPRTPENELEREFYARIAEANRKFREGGAAQIPGWRTDRGRIYLRYGPPDEMLRRPQPPGALPYEAWKYTRQRLLKYCFVDLTRFGNYVLVWTNDRQEKSEPNWRQLLGYEAYEEVMRF
jgi:GWxTD domain-containing protein